MSRLACLILTIKLIYVRVCCCTDPDDKNFSYFDLTIKKHQVSLWGLTLFIPEWSITCYSAATEVLWSVMAMGCSWNPVALQLAAIPEVP